jgi:hypothetical protein
VENRGLLMLQVLLKKKNERDGLKRTFQTLHPANTQRKNPTPVPVRLELFVSVS